ncbi:hypothetical protein [Nonomuraea insulae]|uniref:Uncharacterized protein n=1 Tax=Nonomuraea insulae TaxID=1616787 RepID=A0ABW1D2G6_9ACTN
MALGSWASGSGVTNNHRQPAGDSSRANALITGLKSISRSCLIAMFSACRRVARMRCMVAGPTGRRYVSDGTLRFAGGRVTGRHRIPVLAGRYADGRPGEVTR